MEHCFLCFTWGEILVQENRIERNDRTNNYENKTKENDKNYRQTVDKYV